MKKKVISLLLALCLIAALLPVSAFAYTGLGTSENPWVIGDAKVYLVNGSELHIYADTPGKTFTEPSYVDAPWATKRDKINSVVVESNISEIVSIPAQGVFGSVADTASLTFERDLDLGTPGSIKFTGATLTPERKVCVVVKGSGTMMDGTENQLWTALTPNIVQLELEDGVTNVGAKAFFGATKLKTVTIPDSVLSIGQQAFDNTDIGTVLLKHNFSGNRGLTIGDAAFPSEVSINLEVTGSDNTWDYNDKSAQPWKNYRANINSVQIGYAAYHIAGYAFAGCNNIKSLALYFAGTTAATKTVGDNWMLGVNEKPTVSMVATSIGPVAFKEWTGAGLAFGNAYSANTTMDYKGESFTVTANWTDENPGIKLEPQENKNFGELEYGYATVDLYTVKVTNIGNTTLALTIEMTGGNSSAFVLSANTMTLASGKSESFSVSPKAGQAIGGYKSTVALKDSENRKLGSFDVKYNVGTSYTRAEDFVKRLYKYVLNRTGDQIKDDPGVADWSTKIAENTITAAEVAAGFFGSEEFRNRTLNDTEFVKILYRAMMDREYDEGGLKTWTDCLAAGKTRSWVFKQFVDSVEFHNLCNYYGLTIGSVDYTKYDMGKSNVEQVANQKIKDFVERLYVIALGRPSDEAGKKDWCNQLVTKKSTGAVVAAGFFGSSEYRNMKHDDTAFLTDLYKAMFNRAVDATGLKTWGDALAAGKGRPWVFQQVCGSQEFINLCKEYGVNPGTIDPKKYDMGSSTSAVVSDTNAKNFVKNLYKNVLGRDGTDAEVQPWVDEIMKNGKTGADVAIALYTSAEYSARKLDNTAFVKSLYYALLGRNDANITAAEVNGYAARLAENKTTRIAVFAEFIKSAEYKARCAAIKLTPGSVDTKKYVIDPSLNVITNEDAMAFVKTLYKRILGRDATDAEAQPWADKIVKNGYTGAQVITALYGSVEYANRHQTNMEFVESLYLGVLGRAEGVTTGEEIHTHADPIGAGTTTRGKTLETFLKSAEYKARCAAIKLTPGSIDGSKITIA